MLKDLKIISPRYPDSASISMPISVLKDFINHFTLALGMCFVEKKELAIEIFIDEDAIKINLKERGTNLIYTPENPNQIIGGRRIR